MGKNVRADESVLHPATTNSISMRTTIPSYIVAKLELKKGERFRWQIEGDELKVQIIRDGI
jgi:hypothetical protein